MSVQISCTICGESSPRTVDTGPAVEWSRAHRCTTERLIQLVAERPTVSRLGRQTARETDRDLVLMGEIAKRLAEHQADDTARRLSMFLDEVTGGLLSKSTYAVSDMVQATDERYSRLRDEAVAEALADIADPQGDPSEAHALENFLGKLAGDGAYALDFSSAESLHVHIVSLLKRDIANLRAAGGVR